MNALLKDRYKVGLALATLFFLGILVSVYTIYSLPHELNLTDGYQSSFGKVYTIVALTFLTGAVGLWVALQAKQEVIVFRERKLQDQTIAEKEASDANQKAISLENIRVSMTQPGSAKEKLQAGVQAICRQLEAGQGALYLTTRENDTRKVELKAGYALNFGESTVVSFEYGEGLVGQAAASGKTLYIDDVPEGYIKILSGLGNASPRYLLIVPVRLEGNVTGVLEIASFTSLSEEQRKFVEASADLIAAHLNGK